MQACRNPLSLSLSAFVTVQRQKNHGMGLSLASSLLGQGMEHRSTTGGTWFYKGLAEADQRSVAYKGSPYKRGYGVSMAVLTRMEARGWGMWLFLCMYERTNFRCDQGLSSHLWLHLECSLIVDVSLNGSFHVSLKNLTDEEDGNRGLRLGCHSQEVLF